MVIPMLSMAGRQTISNAVFPTPNSTRYIRLSNMSVFGPDSNLIDHEAWIFYHNGTRVPGTWTATANNFTVNNIGNLFDAGSETRTTSNSSMTGTANITVDFGSVQNVNGFAYITWDTPGRDISGIRISMSTNGADFIEVANLTWANTFMPSGDRPISTRPNVSRIKTW